MRLIMGAALLLTACGSDPKRGEPLPSPEELATTSAQQVLSGVPKSLGGGVEVTGAKADGRTLVVALTGMTDWRGDYTDAAMATTMSRAICFLPGVDALGAGGGKVRLESRTAARQNLPPLTIARC
jgi:hypothetical protein